MSLELRARLFAELDAMELVDPHTHINPLAPASTTLADILGYHYYTELAHSAGLARSRIEDPSLSAKEKVGRLVEWLEPLENTIQVSWLVEMCQTFFGFQEERITTSNWESLFDASRRQMSDADWSCHVLRRSHLKSVFLTNDFDDPLQGFDTTTFVPCLRTDDLVFHLGKPEVRARLRTATGMSLESAAELRQAIGSLFSHFTRHGARACAISLPPDFAPCQVDEGEAASAVERTLAGDAVHEEDRRLVSRFVFWTLAQACDEFHLPFDLMIGVNRRVYAEGVFQGQDLFDSRVSLIQYATLFNAFPGVLFPVSVLASVTNQELVSFSWIFPNVITHGHWWYSNIPTYIEWDAAARLQAVPRTKQIGYYSDMYKLEFALPKFRMYKRTLAKILAERFVLDQNWSEERALRLGWQVLRGNVDRVFYPAEH